MEHTLSRDGITSGQMWRKFSKGSLVFERMIVLNGSPSISLNTWVWNVAIFTETNYLQSVRGAHLEERTSREIHEDAEFLGHIAHITNYNTTEKC